MEIKPLVTNLAEALVDEVPGARTILTVIEEGSRQRRIRLRTAYLENLAKMLATKQDARAGALALEHLKEEHAAEAVERGYEAMMQATSPLARVCIAALVAEYVHHSRAPDRVYRRLAGLFEDLADDEMPFLQEVVGAVSSLSPQAGWYRGQVTIATRVDGELKSVLVKTQDEHSHVHRAPTFTGGSKLSGVFQMLVRHGLANPWTGWSGDDDGHSEDLIVPSGEPLQSFQILLACISVASSSVSPQAPAR